MTIKAVLHSNILVAFVYIRFVLQEYWTEVLRLRDILLCQFELFIASEWVVNRVNLCSIFRVPQTFSRYYIMPSIPLFQVWTHAILFYEPTSELQGPLLCLPYQFNIVFDFGIWSFDMFIVLTIYFDVLCTLTLVFITWAWLSHSVFLGILFIVDLYAHRAYRYVELHRRLVNRRGREYFSHLFLGLCIVLDVRCCLVWQASDGFFKFTFSFQWSWLPIVQSSPVLLRSQKIKGKQASYQKRRKERMREMKDHLWTWKKRRAKREQRWIPARKLPALWKQ